MLDQPFEIAVVPLCWMAQISTRVTHSTFYFLLMAFAFKFPPSQEYRFFRFSLHPSLMWLDHEYLIYCKYKSSRLIILTILTTWTT